MQDFKDALLAFTSTALRQGRTGVVMLVEEIQDVDVMSLSVVGRAWQELQSEAADQPFAMFTAGLPSSPSWVTRAATFLERADMHEVPPLPADGTRLALTNLAAQRGVSWDRQALEAAVLYSAGHPYVMQLVGDNVWKAAGRPEPGAVLTMEHVMTATISATTGMGGLFRARWDRASAKEQQVLAAIARTGHDKPVTRRDIEASTGMDHSELGMQRTRLIDKGLIGSPTRWMLAFTLPGFGAWILAHLDESPQSVPSRAELLQQLQQLHAQLQAMGPPESPNAGGLQTSAGLDWQPGQEIVPGLERRGDAFTIGRRRRTTTGVCPVSAFVANVYGVYAIRTPVPNRGTENRRPIMVTPTDRGTEALGESDSIHFTARQSLYDETVTDEDGTRYTGAVRHSTLYVALQESTDGLVVSLETAFAAATAASRRFGDEGYATR